MVMFVGANYLAAELDPRHWRGVVIIKRGTFQGPLHSNKDRRGGASVALTTGARRIPAP
jgi:hypothetical protein